MTESKTSLMQSIYFCNWYIADALKRGNMSEAKDANRTLHALKWRIKRDEKTEAQTEAQTET